MSRSSGLRPRSRRRTDLSCGLTWWLCGCVGGWLSCMVWWAPAAQLKLRPGHIGDGADVCWLLQMLLRGCCEIRRLRWGQPCLVCPAARPYQTGCCVLCWMEDGLYAVCGSACVVRLSLCRAVVSRTCGGVAPVKCTCATATLLAV